MILDDFDNSAVGASVIYNYESSDPDFLSNGLFTSPPIDTCDLLFRIRWKTVALNARIVKALSVTSRSW